MSDTWEERMGAKKKRLAERDLEILYRLNEEDFPKKEAEASAAEQCQDCVEVRQEYGRWLVFGTCGVDCPHEHHKDDGPGYA